MTTQNICCGCILDDDYGTSTVAGDGSETNPYSVRQIDPTFNRPVVRAIKTLATSQTITTGVDTAITFNSTIFDSHGMFNVANNTRLTIPIEGLYLLGADIPWDTTSAFKQIRFRLNGSLFFWTATHIRPVSGAFPNNIQYTYTFSVGDYVEVIAQHQQGSDLNVVSNTAQPCNFWMMYLGKRV